MALIAQDPTGSKTWWRELTGFLHDLFHSDEQAERRELLARAAAERAERHKAERERTEPAAPQWLRLD